MQKKCSMIYLILPPKADEGWIKPNPCQVNSTWLELTYYIETLAWTLNKMKSWGEMQEIIDRHDSWNSDVD